MIRRFPRRSVLLASLASFALFAAACGDDDGGSTPATTAAPATTAGGGATAAPATTAAAVDPKADWPKKLVLAAVPAEQDAQLQESYSVTRQILEDQLGITVDFFQAADYAGVVEALIANRVDVAQFGPFAYVIAVANGADAEVVGVMVSEKDGAPGYTSLLVARSDNNEINKLEDIRGKRVCFVDPSSTSGYLFPIAALLDKGIDPEKDVTPIFAGGHDASVISVVNGDCDAGFAFDSMVRDLLVERGEIKRGDVKEVDESPIIAGSPMAMRRGLPESLKVAIRDIFQNKINVDWAAANGYCETNDPLFCSFSDEKIWGYVVRDDSYYDGIRLVCRETKAPRCQGVS
jgi:phosphonate transport system substrate-binding protein